jgi:hypothetical protein
MSDLRDWLENAEIRYRRIFHSIHPLPAGALNPPALQIFAYHEKHDPARFPVICIGSNYSQGPGKVEEKCSADLSQWWENYLRMRRIFEGDSQRKRQWVFHKWSSSRFPALPSEEEAFFLMTNLCPWISASSWRDLEQKHVYSLLSNSKLGGEYRHVEELFACLLQQ